MSINGHSKGKGPLKSKDDNDKFLRKYHQQKVGLMKDGFVLAKPEQGSEWHLAQVTEVTPIKSTLTNNNSA
jgi:hypothetical protein